MRYASEVSFSKYYTMLKGLLSTTTLKGVFYMETINFIPTVFEVQKAKDAFLAEMNKHAESIFLPDSHPAHMSKEIALSCAISAVWVAGRKYQYSQMNKVTTY